MLLEDGVEAVKDKIYSLMCLVVPALKMPIM